MRAIVVINGNSGKREPQKLSRQIQLLFPMTKIATTFTILEFNNYITAHLNEFDLLVVAGGDGTVNTAAHLLESYPDKSLAVIPIGSGNGFAREAGFNISLNKLKEAILKGQTRYIDTLYINQQLCDNISGIGFDGLIANTFSTLPKRGLTSYITAFFKEVNQFVPFKAEVNLPNQTISGIFSSIIVANSSQFGNEAHIAPMARIDSGKYVLVLVKKTPLWAYPKLVMQLFTKNITKSNYITHIELDSTIQINTTYWAYHIDGEPHHNTNGLTITLNEKNLKILAT